MNAKLYSLILTVAISAGVAAHADVADQKTATRIDFNRMIDDNNTARAELKKNIDQNTLQAKEEEAERIKVIKFTDVEVGWGVAPPVSRKYDSVE